MARQLALKTVTLEGDEAFDYGEMMLAVLRTGDIRGLSLEDVISAVDAARPIREAKEAGQSTVVLSDDQWKTLVNRLASFRWRIADPAIAEFGLHIRNAVEMGTAL
jgi:hypothetical protein